METKSLALGAAGTLLLGGMVFGLALTANAENQPAPAPVSTVAVVEATEPTPEPVVSEPAAEPAPAPVEEAPVESAPVEPAPVVAEPAPVYVAPVAPAPVYVAPAPAPESGQNTYYTKPTAPPASGPDPSKNTGLYDQPATGELYWNSDDVPK